MTRRLYYTDAKLREFKAAVVAQDKMEDEDGVLRPAVALDRTAFYPTSGGQPHDIGTLAGVPVVAVAEDAAGRIWHLLASPLPSGMIEVCGKIDWKRRFDHMQQHSGQHLLSAVFEAQLAAHTIGFHLGSVSSTIDLDRANLTWEAAFEIERQVNEVIWQNRPVTVHTVTQDEVADLPLRKPPAVEGDVRVIRVADVDASACGGTHVATTGEIGVLKITGVTHYKSGIRVDFLCGGRALADYQQSLKTLQTAGMSLSVGAMEVPDAVERLQEEVKATNQELRCVLSDLLDYEADALWREADASDGRRQIISHWVDRNFDEVRSLASRLREHERTVVLLAAVSSQPDAGGVRIVCARSDDLDGVDANALIRVALDALGGRGGGRPTLAQGGASYQPPETVRDALESAVLAYLA